MRAAFPFGAATASGRGAALGECAWAMTRGGDVLGELAVGYLFLGGTGAGAIAVASVLDLALVRAPFGTDARVSADEAPPCERVVAFALLAGFAALALGVLCLLFDLGRIDRALDLFLRPSPTYLTVGSFALAALVACGAFLALVRFAYLPFAPRAAVAAVEAVAVAVGLVVVVYTGLLLQGLGAVALWRSPLIPALFALSSLSCGIAVVLAAAFFADPDGAADRVVRPLVRADAAVIVLEAVAAALFAGLALASDHPGAAASAAQLVSGSGALAWWGGFVACGLAAPLAVELAFAARVRARAQERAQQPALRAALAVAAVLVLVGGLSMRGAIVDAGMHRNLELEEPIAQALRLE